MIRQINYRELNAVLKCVTQTFEIKEEHRRRLVWPGVVSDNFTVSIGVTGMSSQVAGVGFVTRAGDASSLTFFFLPCDLSCLIFKVGMRGRWLKW
jgi:hypothetical protein